MSIPLLAYPTNASNAFEDQWKNLPMQSNGVIWPTRGQGFLLVFADSTGLQVKVTSGSVLIDNFCGDLLTQQTLAIATPDATNPRIDLVVARLDRSGPAATITILVIQGTPAVNPAVPAATALDVPLAQVRVEKLPNASIIASKVTTVRPWTGSTAWTDLGNVTVQASSSDSGTVVDSSTTSIARWRVTNGDLELNYLVNISLHGSSPSHIFLGLPNPSRSNGSLCGSVGGHPVETVFDSINGGSSISYARMYLGDLPVLNSAWTLPISPGFTTYAYVSGSYEMVG